MKSTVSGFERNPSFVNVQFKTEVNDHVFYTVTMIGGDEAVGKEDAEIVQAAWEKVKGDIHYKASELAAIPEDPEEPEEPEEPEVIGTEFPVEPGEPGQPIPQPVSVIDEIKNELAQTQLALAENYEQVVEVQKESTSAQLAITELYELVTAPSGGADA